MALHLPQHIRYDYDNSGIATLTTRTASVARAGQFIDSMMKPLPRLQQLTAGWSVDYDGVPDRTMPNLVGAATIPGGETLSAVQLGSSVLRNVLGSFIRFIAQGVGGASGSQRFASVYTVTITGGLPFYTIAGATDIRTASTHQVRATNQGTLIGYFNVAADGTWSFFHADNDREHWTFDLVRLSDGHQYPNSWTNARDLLWASTTYEFRYGTASSDANIYPFGSPAPAFSVSTVLPAGMSGTDLISPDFLSALNGAGPDVVCIGIFNSGTGAQYGPLAYVRRQQSSDIARVDAAGLGSRYTDLRFDLLTLTSTQIYHDSFPVEASGRFSLLKGVGVQAELTLVRVSTGAFLARASMTTGLPRSYQFYPGDTDLFLEDGSHPYGNDGFEENAYTYDAAVTVLSFLTRLRYVEARRICYGLARATQSNGAVPFAWPTRYEPVDPGIQLYRSGAIAWCAYAMLKTVQLTPAKYKTAPYDAWFTTITAKAKAILNWLNLQRGDATKLVRGGTGVNYAPTGTVTAAAGAATFSVSQAGIVTNGSLVIVAGVEYLVSAFDGTTHCTLAGVPTFSAAAYGVFDPGAQLPWHSTEHNTDCWFAFKLASVLYPTDTLTNADLTTQTYLSIAGDIKTNLLAYHWRGTPNYRFWQGTSDAIGTPDGQGALDVNSWGALLLHAWLDDTKAAQALAWADAHYAVVAADGTPGYTGFIPTTDGYPSTVVPSLWVEGTCGMIVAESRVPTIVSPLPRVEALAALQEPDGSWRYAQISDPYNGSRFRSTESAAWVILANDPTVAFWTEHE